jgi:hypothetical protein
MSSKKETSVEHGPDSNVSVLTGPNANQDPPLFSNISVPVPVPAPVPDPVPAGMDECTRKQRTFGSVIRTVYHFSGSVRQSFAESASAFCDGQDVCGGKV